MEKKSNQSTQKRPTNFETKSNRTRTKDFKPKQVTYVTLVTRGRKNNQKLMRKRCLTQSHLRSILYFALRIVTSHKFTPDQPANISSHANDLR